MFSHASEALEEVNHLGVPRVELTCNPQVLRVHVDDLGMYFAIDGAQVRVRVWGHRLCLQEVSLCKSRTGSVNEFM
jgi:hypothetical protein